MQDPLFIFNGNFEFEYLYNASKAFPILLSDIIIYLIQMEGKSYKKISQYRISDQLLGEGSYSKVYLAWDSFLNPVAAKVIPLSSLSSNFFIIQFKKSLIYKAKYLYCVNANTKTLFLYSRQKKVATIFTFLCNIAKKELLIN